jgi:hypothetical protein
MLIGGAVTTRQLVARAGLEIAVLFMQRVSLLLPAQARKRDRGN